MKEVLFISGKGGAGKTSLLAAVAQAAGEDGISPVLGDCDVDASNLPLLFSVTGAEKESFSGGRAAVMLRPEDCTACKKCVRECRFDALRWQEGQLVLHPALCEGCGLCVHLCPANVLEMQDVQDGYYYKGEGQLGPMVYAELFSGAEHSGRLVQVIKEESRKQARATQRDYVFLDGPPGVGCPVISAFPGVSQAVLVTEPSVSGLHDLKRVVALCRHFSVPAVAVLNKADLNKNAACNTRAYLSEEGIPLLGEIPYDKAFQDNQKQGQAPELTEQSRSLWQQLKEVL